MNPLSCNLDFGSWVLIPESCFLFLGAWFLELASYFLLPVPQSPCLLVSVSSCFLNLASYFLLPVPQSPCLLVSVSSYFLLLGSWFVVAQFIGLEKKRNGRQLFQHYEFLCLFIILVFACGKSAEINTCCCLSVLVIQTIPGYFIRTRVF